MGTDRLAEGRYEIRFSDEASDHLDTLTARQRATLLDSTERQLSYQPAVKTRHRKRMEAGREGFVAPWELRMLVVVVAVGVKIRNRLRIAGKEYEP